MRRRQTDRDELKVVACAKCSIYDTEYVVVLGGNELPIGSLFELVKHDNGLDQTFAVVEVMERDLVGNYQARPIWAAPGHAWGPCPGIFVYPNVVVRPYVTRRAIELYMADEGSVDLAHVLEADRIYFIYRRTGIGTPWVCYALDRNGGEYVTLYSSVTLAEMKAKLSELCPLQRSVVDTWGTEGARVINVMDYGARGNGDADDTAAIFRALKTANRGDVVYFPYGRTFKVNRPLPYPAGVKVDVRDGQIIVSPAGDVGG